MIHRLREPVNDPTDFIADIVALIRNALLLVIDRGSLPREDIFSILGA